MDEQGPSSRKRLILLIINCIILIISFCSAPLIMRLYFLRGGRRIWFSSWLQAAGFPILLIPLLISYTRNRSPKLFLLNRRVCLAAAVIGILTGLDGYLLAYGFAKLPVSTSSLIMATQLAFTAGFAFLIVKQRFTSYSINAVALLTVGAVVLGIHGGGDRPKGESTREYFLGFFMNLAGAALYGLILTLVELTYKKAQQAVSYTLVMEIQLVLCFIATVFCTVGMLINNDFKAIGREAKQYELGESKYYLVVVWSAILWQSCFLGIIGVIFYSSSLFSAMIITMLLPATQVLAVIFFHEKFQAEKGVSLFLSLWGFVSYFYGEIKHIKKNKKNTGSPNSKDETTPAVEAQLAHQNQIDP